MVSAGIGNTIEWYDWTIFATFLVFISPNFFPPGNDVAANLSTAATYALAFFFRPLGGWLLGRFADTRGRKNGILLTIMLMAGASLVIGILPTFEQVGWLAPILLLLARIAQGMSLGCEVSNASAYLAEIAPPERRGRYSSFFYISTGTSVLLASLLGVLLANLLTDHQLTDYGCAVTSVAAIFLAEQARLGPLQRNSGSGDHLVRAGRELALVLRRRSRCLTQPARPRPQDGARDAGARVNRARVNQART